MADLQDLQDLQDHDEIDETLGGFIVPDPDSDSDVSAEDIPDDDEQVQAILREEAEKITSNIQSTVVNGRALRDRTTLAAPKDEYWERFGKRTSEKLAVVEHKREMLDDIKAWKKEFAGTKPDFQWPNLTLRNSTEAIEQAHQLVIDTFELELADDEEDSDDMDVDDDMDDDEDSEDEEDSDDDEDDEDDEDDDVEMSDD
jgi:hypothetical protein